MTRMFQGVKTWNPITGCLASCSYCWAEELANTRLSHLPQYEGCFNPYFNENALLRVPKSGTVFVSSMGDAFGEWVPKEWIEEMLDTVRGSPKATFLFLTKNPARYHDFVPLPDNAICGATIETNRADLIVSNAPEPGDRALAMRLLPGYHGRRFLSIEPIMQFDLGVMVDWVKAVMPEFVYIGMDNHNHHLPEPSSDEIWALVEELQRFTEVRIKTIRGRWNAQKTS